MSAIRYLISSFPRMRIVGASLRPYPIRSAAARRHASSTPHPVIASNWPWRIVSQDASTGIQVLERTVYARPPSFSPRMLWLVIIAWTPMCLMIFENVRYAYTHPRKTIEQPYKPTTTAMSTADQEAVVAATSEKGAGAGAGAVTGASTQASNATSTEAVVASSSPTAAAVVPQTSVQTASLDAAAVDAAAVVAANDDQMSLLDFVSYTAGIGFVGLGITAFALYYPTRVITRLTQVQRRPMRGGGGGGGGKTETLIKVENAAMSMWKWPKRFAEPRILRPDELRVEMIRQGKVDSPYLKLHITPKGSDNPGRHRRRRLLPSLDDQSYRLAFHKIQPGDYGIGNSGKKRAGGGGGASSAVKKEQEEEVPPVEVVVSLNRLQEALGSVRHAERNLK